jgi:hypothetical protein
MDAESITLAAEHMVFVVNITAKKIELTGYLKQLQRSKENISSDERTR